MGVRGRSPLPRRARRARHLSATSRLLLKSACASPKSTTRSRSDCLRRPHRRPYGLVLRRCRAHWRASAAGGRQDWTHRILHQVREIGAIAWSLLASGSCAMPRRQRVLGQISAGKEFVNNPMWRIPRDVQDRQLGSRATNGATELREPHRTGSTSNGLSERHKRQRMRSRRYRTQEVAGSSPASSITEVAANRHLSRIAAIKRT